MRKAGGIVAIVAGSLGLLGAIIGLLFGGFLGQIDMEQVNDALEQGGTSLEELSEELSDDEAQTEEIDLSDPAIEGAIQETGEGMQKAGWIGMVFSIATIVIGVFAIRASNWIPGAVLIVCSLIGIFVAGGFVQYMMYVTALGGILALFPLKPEEPAAEEE